LQSGRDKNDHKNHFRRPDRSEYSSEEKTMIDLPKTVDEAVNQILAEFSLQDKVTMARLEKNQMQLLDKLLVEYLKSQLRQWPVNRELYEDCRARCGEPDFDEAEVAKVIIQEIWKQVRQTHRLRVVK